MGSEVEGKQRSGAKRVLEMSGTKIVWKLHTKAHIQLDRSWNADKRRRQSASKLFPQLKLEVYVHKLPIWKLCLSFFYYFCLAKTLPLQLRLHPFTHCNFLEQNYDDFVYERMVNSRRKYIFLPSSAATNFWTLLQQIMTASQI